MRRILREWQWRQQRPALAALELLVLDVDGVLTDGGLWFDPAGQLQKRFDVRDGLGIRLLQQAGLSLAFLSGGKGAPPRCGPGNWHRPLPAGHQGLTGGPGAAATAANTAFFGDDLNHMPRWMRSGLCTVSPMRSCATDAGSVRYANWRNVSFKPR